MVKRSGITLADIATLDNLASAFWQAARGKRTRRDVQHFAARLPAELAALSEEIRHERVQVGHYDVFRVWDPKPRVIHAPCLRERVLHHALMAHLGPVLDRALVDDSYACRVGKGSLAAVLRAQQHVRRFAWYAKLDVRSYFASIDHEILRQALARRFKNAGVLRLCDRILRGHQGELGRGLPIGALTSQHFANLYLSLLDRHLLEQVHVRGLVRYMDDVLVFCDTRDEALSAARAAAKFAHDRLKLELRDERRIQRSALGVPFLGYRVYAGTLRLSRRRMQRYRSARRQWEQAYENGRLDGLGLQAGYASALAITAHVDSRGFRQQELVRRPPLDA